MDFIAEIGVNNEGDMCKALLMIDQLAVHGGTTAKFQTYKASKLAAKKSPAYWDTTKETTKSQHELFSKFDSFGEEEYKKLAEACKMRGLEFLTTAFDLESLEMVDPLVKRHKIASADLTNIPLIRSIAKKQKPVLMSTGASTNEEIKQSVNELKRHNCDDITLLHCVLNYPTPFDHANMSRIGWLIQEFPELKVGYSDHTVPTNDHFVQLLCFAMGCVTLEKHYTFDKTLPGNDHYHAYDHIDLAGFMNLHQRYQFVMKSERFLEEQEAARIHARRGFYAARALKKGQVLTENDIQMLRPASDIPAANYDLVIGATLANDKAVGDVINASDIGLTVDAR